MAETASSLLAKFGYASSCDLSSPLPIAMPLCTSVTKAEAGRTLRSVDSLALALPLVAVKITLAEPSAACAPDLARRWNTVLPSPRSPILSVWTASPTTSRPALTARFSLIVASLPEPAMLLATPMPTSTVSPGAIDTGTVGSSTMSPRTVAVVLAEATVLSSTTTAITRSAPLKLSGTV